MNKTDMITEKIEIHSECVCIPLISQHVYFYSPIICYYLRKDILPHGQAPLFNTLQ